MKINKRWGKALLISVAIAAGAIFLPSSPAQAHTGGPPAGQPYTYGSSWNDPYVRSAFEIHGDDFWVYDASSQDRASAYVYWETDYGRVGSCRNSHGAGKWHECAQDLAENRYVTWWHYSYDGTTGALTIRSGPYQSRTS